MILVILLSLLSSSLWAHTGPNVCDILDIKNCSGVSKQSRRTSMVSLPSPSTAANLNPANVSLDRGVGLEIMHQSGNPSVFNLASGTGQFGAALVNSSLENAFFGNRIPERSDSYAQRLDEKKQYRSRKHTVAIGARLLNRKNFSFDMGLIAKRHTELKRINPGLGLSSRIGPFTLGASFYQDDYLVKNYGGDDSIDTFNVATYSIGTKVGDLGLDFGLIKTKFNLADDHSMVRIFSASYAIDSVLFNLAYRHQNSVTPVSDITYLKFPQASDDFFGGVQLSLGRHFIIGVNYNYFLLNEFSLITTLFI